VAEETPARYGALNHETTESQKADHASEKTFQRRFLFAQNYKKQLKENNEYEDQ
jgi:hypothetical protein